MVMIWRRVMTGGWIQRRFEWDDASFKGMGLNNERGEIGES